MQLFQPSLPLKVWYSTSPLPAYGRWSRLWRTAPFHQYDWQIQVYKPFSAPRACVFPYSLVKAVSLCLINCLHHEGCRTKVWCHDDNVIWKVDLASLTICQTPSSRPAEDIKDIWVGLLYFVKGERNRVCANLLCPTPPALHSPQPGGLTLRRLARISPYTHSYQSGWGWFIVRTSAKSFESRLQKHLWVPRNKDQSDACSTAILTSCGEVSAANANSSLDRWRLCVQLPDSGIS